MSADAASRAAPTSTKEHNTVHEDAIWRQLIKYELDWARSWERKWGFMKQSMVAEKVNRPQVETSSKSTHSSGLPTRRPFLVSEQTYNFSEPVNVPDYVLYPQKRKPNSNRPSQHPSEPSSKLIPDMGPEDRKSFYLLTHKTRYLQLADMPAEKYSFPPTRSLEIGWWTNEAKRELKQDPGHTNSLIDARLGRWARGQGDVYKWWGGGPK